MDSQLTTPNKRFGTGPVFFTAISTILGAILFLRFGYAVGTIGFIGTVMVIVVGHLVTIPTALALSELAVLRERGFNLGIITDTMYPLEWKMKRLKKAGVAEFINIIACSTELGAHKPDPLVYRYAVEQAKLTPADTAFVGHLGSELDGAHQAGMTTIAINYDPGTQADFLCQSIGLLPSLPIFQAGV